MVLAMTAKVIDFIQMVGNTPLRRHSNSMVEEAMTEYWGPRCTDYDANCPHCQAWAEFDARQKS